MNWSPFFFHERTPVVEREAPLALGKHREKQLRALTPTPHRTYHSRRQHLVAHQRSFHIARKFFQSLVAQGNAEVTSGHVFQFMSFVENHRPHLRQDARIGRVLRFLLDREVRKEEMMVDDDDVAFLCPPVHFGDEAGLECTGWAQESDIIIVNHHLFFADLAIKQESEYAPDAGILPEVGGR